MRKSIFISILLLSSLLISASFPIQLLPTSLKIVVRNNLGNTEENVKVQLYKSKEDYRNETQAVSVELTDKKGRVTFKKLEPIVYYINATKGEANNYGMGAQTDTLEEGRINKLTVIIE